MKANLPSAYAKFINTLRRQRCHRFGRDWVCAQPLASTDSAAPEQATKLHEYRDILTRIGSSVAVAKVARVDFAGDTSPFCRVLAVTVTPSKTELGGGKCMDVRG